jgi:hypothetical protein
LGIGKTLANELGSGLCAFVIGENVEKSSKEAFQFGASKVYAIEGAIFKIFNVEAYSKAASFLLGKYKPEVALFRATSQGMDVAAATAANLGFGLCTDSIGIKVDGGQIKLTRAAFGGNYTVTVVNEKAKPQIATVRPKAFAMPEKDTSKSGEVVKETFTVAESQLKASPPFGYLLPRISFSFPWISETAGNMADEPVRRVIKSLGDAGCKRDLAHQYEDGKHRIAVGSEGFIKVLCHQVHGRFQAHKVGEAEEADKEHRIGKLNAGHEQGNQCYDKNSLELHVSHLHHPIQFFNDNY